MAVPCSDSLTAMQGGQSGFSRVPTPILPGCTHLGTARSPALASEAVSPQDKEGEALRPAPPRPYPAFRPGSAPAAPAPAGGRLSMKACTPSSAASSIMLQAMVAPAI